MRGARPNGTNLTVVGQVSLGLRTNMSRESRYGIVWLVRGTRDASLVERLASIYVSRRHQASTW